MRRGRAVPWWLPWAFGWLCCLGHAAALAHGRYALVIGNAAYRGADRLSTPVDDAGLVARQLTSLGFQVSLHTDRSRRDLYEDVDRFAQQAKDADVLVFYYAGHGFEVAGDNFLMPVDLSRPLAELDQATLRREGIALRTVQSALAAAHARAQVILVDACRGAPSRGANPRGMHAQTAANGIVLAWSTAPGGAAVDSLRQLGRDIDHSPFAWYLTGNLAQRQLDLIDVLRRTQREVSAVTGNSQHPWFSSGLVGELYLAEAPADAATPTPTVTHARHRGLDASTASRRLWNHEQQVIERLLFDLDAPGLQALRRRARAGDSQAAAVLGVAYERGDVVRADPTRALRYYRQAADAGYVPGQTLLGEAYYEGRLLPRDVSRAERLLQAAAAAGDTRAQLDLAQLKVRRGDAGAAAGSVRALEQAGDSLLELFQRQARNVQQASGRAAPLPAEKIGTEDRTKSPQRMKTDTGPPM